MVGRGTRPLYTQPTLTPRTKRVIELAVDEARRLGHHYIGTEHLLLGLVREGEGWRLTFCANWEPRPKSSRSGLSHIVAEVPAHAGGKQASTDPDCRSNWAPI